MKKISPALTSHISYVPPDILARNMANKRAEFEKKFQEDQEVADFYRNKAQEKRARIQERNLRHATNQGIQKLS